MATKEKLDAAQAAERIRTDVVGRPSVMDPSEQHRLKFCTEVCQNLGIEATPFNLAVVMDALHDADIEDGAPLEYPKYVVVGKDTNDKDVAVIVQNEDEEHEALNPQAAESAPKKGKAAKAEALTGEA